MSNPWAKSFEELRSPYLQEKMAKKDYDGDGKIESGTDEYKGSVDKAIKKNMAMKGKKKVAEHHQKDADGNTIPHGDGTPSSVEEMAKKFGPGGGTLGDANDKVMKKLKDGTPVKKIEKKIKNLNMGEAKIDTVDPKNKRKRRNEVSFGKQTKPYDPPGKAYKNEMGKFLQKQRKERHDKNRGVKTKGMGEEVVLEADKKGSGSGTKDACYKKVKASASVWPSAYASGRLVQCRKKGAANYGNSKKEEFDFRIKSFDELVGECWKTHERVPGTVKGAKGSCRPKGSAKMKEEFVGEEGINKDPAFNIMRPGGKNSPLNKNLTKKVNPKDFKLPGEVGRMDYLKKLNMGEAVKHPKLDIDEKKKVKNPIKINPEIKTEAAKAPVKK